MGTFGLALSVPIFTGRVLEPDFSSIIPPLELWPLSSAMAFNSLAITLDFVLTEVPLTSFTILLTLVDLSQLWGLPGAISLKQSEQSLMVFGEANGSLSDGLPRALLWPRECWIQLWASSLAIEQTVQGQGTLAFALVLGRGGTRFL